MGIFDKAKDLLSEHSDKVDQGIDKASDYADQRTGNQHSDKIDQGTDTVKDRVGDYLGADDATNTPGPTPAVPPVTPERPA
jgi:hypothetical protein